MQYQCNDDLSKNMKLMSDGQYVIYSPSQYKILGVDNGVGMWAGDGSDGKNEAFTLIETFLLDTHLYRFDDKYKHIIIYPSLDEANRILLEIKDKLYKYFVIDDWMVKRLDTYITLEDVNNVNESAE